MEDNSPETEKLISSFVEVTSSSREVAISVLETHQWNLNAAVSTFTKNEAGEPNVPNPNDDKLLRPTLAPFPIRRINIPVSSFSPFDGSSDYSPSRLRLRSPSPPRFYLQSKRAAANPFGRQTVNRRQGVGDISGGTGTDSTKALESYGGEDNRDIERSEESSRSISAENVSAEFEEEPLEVVTYTVTSWRNGFTIDDSSLKTLDDPENATFLEGISRLESPRELSPVRAQVKLIRREEEYFIESHAGGTLAGSDSASTSEPPALAASPSMRAKESAIERPEQSPRLMTEETVSAELQEEQQYEVFLHIVTIWKNGFTADDSPLKSLDDPENAAFLEMITSMESPRLLDPVRIQVKLIRREEEDFTE